MINAVTNGLNCLMNAKRVGKGFCMVPFSKLLVEVLDIMKKEGYVDYEINKEEQKVKIIIKSINECKAITPRFYATVDEMNKFIRRFLPSRNFGILLISTSKGLITHHKAIENKIGGSLIAYCY